MREHDRKAALRRASMGVYTPAMRQPRSSARSRRIGLPERRKALRLAAALPWVALVAGCGKKGPLYHPPEDDEKSDEERESDQANAAPPGSGERIA